MLYRHGFWADGANPSLYLVIGDIGKSQKTCGLYVLGTSSRLSCIACVLILDSCCGCSEGWDSEGLPTHR